ARYPGARGNAFKVTVQTNPVDAGKKDVLLYEGTTLLRTFTFTGGTVQNAVDAVNGDAGNLWVTASKLADGDGGLANVTGAAMTSGHSGIAGLSNADYVDAFAAFETQRFDALALDGMADAGLQASVTAWIARIRDEGHGAIAVLGGSAAD